jgi:hypothetical protein
LSIIAQLSSQTGDHTSGSNQRAAKRCLADPILLEEIAAGMDSSDGHLAADCAEVLTYTAIQNPEAVAPYAAQLAKQINHRNTMARWEAIHALALIAHLIPEQVAPLLPRFQRIIKLDKSVIVRDHTVDAVANYAAVNEDCAREAYPVLVEALTAWNGKQAHHALHGLQNVTSRLPDLREEIRSHAERCLEVGRPVTQKAAKALLKSLK